MTCCGAPMKPACRSGAESRTTPARRAARRIASHRAAWFRAAHFHAEKMAQEGRKGGRLGGWLSRLLVDFDVTALRNGLRRFTPGCLKFLETFCSSALPVKVQSRGALGAAPASGWNAVPSACACGLRASRSASSRRSSAMSSAPCARETGCPGGGAASAGSGCGAGCACPPPPHSRLDTRRASASPALNGMVAKGKYGATACAPCLADRYSSSVPDMYFPKNSPSASSCMRISWTSSGTGSRRAAGVSRMICVSIACVRSSPLLASITRTSLPARIFSVSSSWVM